MSDLIKYLFPTFYSWHRFRKEDRITGAGKLEFRVLTRRPLYPVQTSVNDSVWRLISSLIDPAFKKNKEIWNLHSISVKLLLNAPGPLWMPHIIIRRRSFSREWNIMYVSLNQSLFNSKLIKFKFCNRLAWCAEGVFIDGYYKADNWPVSRTDLLSIIILTEWLSYRVSMSRGTVVKILEILIEVLKWGANSSSSQCKSNNNRHK